MAPRVRSEILVHAHLRLCESRGAFATVARMGDPDAGLVLVRVLGSNRMACLFLEGRSFEGRRYWRDLSEGMQPEGDIQQLIDKQLSFDPDLWIVDVEDRDGNPHLEDRIIAKDQL